MFVFTRNQERNILKQLPSETLNLMAKSIVCSPSLNLIIVNKNSSFEDNLLSFPIFLGVVINCLSLRNWSKPLSHKGSYNIMELVEELQLVKICEEVA